MKTQRKVNKKLGKNQTKDHDKLYKLVEERIGSQKSCKGVGCIKHIHTQDGNEREESLPIREFDLHKSSKSGLQGRCRNCEKRYRRYRINKSKEKNKGDVYNNYKIEYGKSSKVCSRCKEDKDIENFNKSISMECGLHNMCKSCCKIYGDSVGDRIIKYLPDGNFKYTKTEKNQHDDHIMPLSVGGSNEEQNHQLLSDKENLEKSDTIPYNNINEIPDNQLCERWRYILENSKKNNDSIREFECKIRKAIYNEQTKRYNMSEKEHIEYLKAYNKKNNRRMGEKRAYKKFIEFYKIRYIK